MYSNKNNVNKLAVDIKPQNRKNIPIIIIIYPPQHTFMSRLNHYYVYELQHNAIVLTKSMSRILIKASIKSFVRGFSV